MCLPEQSARDAALAELARVDPAALDAASLMGQIADLAVFISQAQGQLSRLAGALDATGGAAEAGHKSASAFLRTRCGLSRGHAAAVTATARGLAGLAATQKAVEAGTVSFDQAQIITRAAGGLQGSQASQVEQLLLDHGPGLDTSQFRHLAAEAACRADPGGAEEREKKRWDKRHLSFGLTLDNTGMLSGACGDTVGYEIVRTAAEAFAPPGGQAGARTAAQRRMDGLSACRGRSWTCSSSRESSGMRTLRRGTTAPGVSTHDGLDREPCRECGGDCDAKKPGELAVSGGIRIRSDDPPQRVPEGKSYERREACNNRRVDQPPPHTRERGTTADYSEIGTSQHQEGEHSAGEQAHRKQGRGEEVPLPDSLIEAHCGTERK
jgi:hypothetical protein